MSVVSIILAVLSAAAGWLVRHYQIPKHHRVVDKALADRAEAEAKAVVAGLFTAPAPPADPAKK